MATKMIVDDKMIVHDKKYYLRYEWGKYLLVCKILMPEYNNIWDKKDHKFTIFPRFFKRCS